tara:strand:- start:645 stop:1811 length:1167 start_codon:yes stop_codon:yes gene_type:complete
MKILIVVTGSIAAVKCEEIIKNLQLNNFKVSCLFTANSLKIINFSKIKKLVFGKVYLDRSEINNKMLHIKLSRENDIILVCPATANTIAKYSNGFADNLALSTLLASNKDIIFVPAMNSAMWNNKINQKNISFLSSSGYEFIGPKTGKLKCGEFGIGRIATIKEIIEKLDIKMKYRNFYNKKNCLVTAGPTIEYIDPIRYLSNFSSGKQGYEIASQLSMAGANVTLVSGPTNLNPPNNVKLIKVETADEMLKKILKLSNLDIGIFTAAVADYKANKISSNKIKKTSNINLKLIKNTDILKKISFSKFRPKIVVGFAAETGGTELAKKKLLEKNCDLIIYNKVNKKNNVFGSDSNKISIITKNKSKKFKKMSKVNCAKEIIKYIYLNNL